MTRQNLRHTLIDINFKPINFFFVFAHAINQPDIAFSQGLHTVLHHGLNEPTHLQ